jgi:tetratricopeptide (TPR) repeat protein
MAENGRRPGPGSRNSEPRKSAASAPRKSATSTPRKSATSAPRKSATSAPRKPAASAPPKRSPRGSGTTPDLPPVPENADASLLDRGVRAELRSLSKPNAEAVAKHLVVAGQALDSDPRRALAHARAARARAGRVAAVREAVGIAAYHAGEWSEALTELRTARRISGDPRNLPVIADCERALGRPEQAAKLLSDPDVRRLDAETRAELLIVVAGARRDRGQLDAALSVLARGGLDRDRPRPGAARLWYAYADILAAAGRTEEAASWFAASAALDPDGELDAAERAAALL